ncbi:MAG: hypothetical protein ACREBF_00295 [Candidatus Micrarchaeales archaeon]
MDLTARRSAPSTVDTITFAQLARNGTVRQSIHPADLAPKISKHLMPLSKGMTNTPAALVEIYLRINYLNANSDAKVYIEAINYGDKLLKRFLSETMPLIAEECQKVGKTLNKNKLKGEIRSLYDKTILPTSLQSYQNGETPFEEIAVRFTLSQLVFKSIE